METEVIIKGSLAIVGATQMLKSLIPLKKGWAWTIITIVVGIGICGIPARFLDPIITVAGAALFYDTIYQTFEKVFKRTTGEQ